MRKMAHHVISQLLYLQMIMLIVDSEYARHILSLHTARYKQPLNNCIYTPCDYSFETNPFEIYLSIKDLDNLAEFNLLQKSSSMYTKICLCHKLRISWRNRR